MIEIHLNMIKIQDIVFLVLCMLYSHYLASKFDHMVTRLLLQTKQHFNLKFYLSSYQRLFCCSSVAISCCRRATKNSSRISNTHNVSELEIHNTHVAFYMCSKINRSIHFIHFLVQYKIINLVIMWNTFIFSSIRLTL